MESSVLYFSDNFFSSGLTTIYNEQKEEVGRLDLKSAFSSKLDVLDNDGSPVIQGRFRFFSHKWSVTDNQGREIGLLKQGFSFFSKKYFYDVGERGRYQIVSEAFSKEYNVLDDKDTVIAHFEKTSGFFQSPTFKLTNHSSNLSNEELIAVVMGIAMIQKQNTNAATASST